MSLSNLTRFFWPFSDQWCYLEVKLDLYLDNQKSVLRDNVSVKAHLSSCLMNESSAETIIICVMRWQFPLYYRESLEEVTGLKTTGTGLGESTD